MKRSLLATVLLLTASAAAADWCGVRIGNDTIRPCNPSPTVQKSVSTATRPVGEPAYVRRDDGMRKSGTMRLGVSMGVVSMTAAASEDRVKPLVGYSYAMPLVGYSHDVSDGRLTWSYRADDETRPVGEPAYVRRDDGMRKSGTMRLGVSMGVVSMTAAASEDRVKPLVGYSYAMPLVGYSHDVSDGRLTWSYRADDETRPVGEPAYIRRDDGMRKSGTMRLGVSMGVVSMTAAASEDRVKSLVGYSHAMPLVGYSHDVSDGRSTWSYRAGDDKLPPNPFPYPPFPPKL